MGALADALGPRAAAGLKSNAQLRDERRLADAERWDLEEAERNKERHRVANLSLWGRIEEIKDLDEVKEVLHLMAERLGLE